MEVEDIDISPLIKAFNKFHQFSKNLGTEQEKAGTIQAFEYSFELSWKTMKRILNAKGHTTNSPKDTFRLAALNNMIQDPEIWFYFLSMKNLTVHTYNEANMKIVVDCFPQFIVESNKLLNHLGVLK